MKLVIFGVVCILAAVNCGRPGPHIIGGREAGVCAWPWQAALQYKRSGSHSCGGTLVSKNYVLTAAHCVHDISLGTMKVVLGLHKRGNTDVGMPVSYDIKSIILHPSYDDATLYNDIALLKIDEVTLNTCVQTIDPAPSGNNLERNWGYMTGWGVTTEDGGYLSSTLQEANVQVYTKEECSKHWFVRDSLICVGVMHNKGSCSGDSGGPFVTKINGNYHVAGVTSFGTVGCRTSKPSMYTRVSYYESWIRSYIDA